MITLTTVPYKKMRYKSCGDWFQWGGESRVISAELGDWKMEACIQIHELVEAWLCKAHGISELLVDEFDMAYRGEGEPGDDPACPYRIEHQAASIIERLFSIFLGVDWTEYERRLGGLQN